MRADAWRVNNRGMALGADGQLYDGQHRQKAIVSAGVTVRMLVVRGLEAEARATIDQGSSRSVGGTLRIVDGQPRGIQVVSSLRAIVELETGRARPISHHEARAILEAYEPSVRWFIE